MTTEDDPPTLAERYGAATRSSHLRVQERRCDVDYLIAAGWLQDTLGTRMYRLRIEYDAARAQSNAPNRLEAHAIALATVANLHNLTAARDALGSFAISLATRALFMRPDAEVLILTKQVLNAWLDPLCHHCGGLGFSGGTHRGEQKIYCRPCRGSGQRREWIGEDPEQRRFAALLLLEIEQHQAHVDRTMRKFLAQWVTDKVNDA